MENLGQYLKSLRDANGISMEKVCKDLRLSPEQINRIETNQLSSLGDHGFSRALVYTYVRYLEADEKTAMNLFDLAWPPQKQTHFTARTPIREKKHLISINFIWIIAICLIVVILGSIIWLAYTRGYLKRPFDTQTQKEDTTVTVAPVLPKVEKPDTLRQHMLNLAQSNLNKVVPVAPKTDRKTTGNVDSVTDTTDYLDEMIFKSHESPFNPRL